MISTEQERKFSDLDRPVRYLLAVLGCMSGPPVAQTTLWKALTTCWSIFIILLQFVLGILVVATAFDRNTTWSFNTSISVVVMVFTFSANFIAGLLAIGCHKKLWIPRYYEKLVKIEADCQQHGIKLPKTFSTTQKFWTIAFVSLTLSCMTMYHMDFFWLHKTPLVGDLLFARNLTLNLEKVIRQSNYVYTSISAVVYYATNFYIIILVTSISTLLSQFNSGFQAVIQSSPQVALNNLHKHRLIHLELCQLIETTNDFLSPIYACTVGSHIISLLFALYAIAKVCRPEMIVGNEIIITQLVFWTGGMVMMLALHLYHAHVVGQQVSILHLIQCKILRHNT